MLAAAELHGPAGFDIDARDNHDRTSNPALARLSFNAAYRELPAMEDARREKGAGAGSRAVDEVPG